MSSSSESYTYATADSLSGSKAPFTLRFTDVKAWVRNLKIVDENGETQVLKKRTILRGVSGSASSGELTMCAGASGAGKSTLLDILSSRATSVESSGSITLNGHPFGLAEFQAVAAYCTQDAIFLATQTPEDVLMFKANMVLPAALSREEKQARVDDVISLLGLEHVRSLQLGEPGVSAHGLNFVDRKKLNIAASLLVNPSVLFVDEFSTGLDAASAYLLALSLKKIAVVRSIIVFATIHQPSVKIFNMFDKALVMALGQMAYEGDVPGATAFLEDNGYPCPRFKNPADHLIQVLDTSDGDEARVQELIDINKKNGGGSGSSGTASRSDEVADAAFGNAISAGPGKRPSGVAKLFQLFKRSVQSTFRNEQGLKAAIGQTIGFGILISILYSLDASQEAAADRVGAFILFAVNPLFLSAQGAAFVFISERSVMLREVADGTYSLELYALSKIVAEIPFQISYQVLFGSIVYFSVGLRATFDQFLIFVAILCLTALTGSAIGLMLGAVTADASVATAMSPVVIIPQMLFVLVSKNTVPVWLRWLREISVVRYAFEAFLINEVEDITFRCTDGERLPNGLCPIQTGKDLLEQREANDDPSGIGFRIGMIAAFYVVYVVLTYVGLRFSLRGQKKTKRE